MKIQNIFISFLITLITFSCEQLGDSLRLPGEDPRDIIYYELNNDYLAPESKEYIESNFPSENVNSSFILIGKNTYGFEADLTNDKSLSFDEDGVFKYDREHPFIKDKYIKGKYGRGKGEDKDEGESRDKGEGKDKDEDIDRGEGKEVDRCFEYLMPYTMIMPDSSTITITAEGDRDLIKRWYDDNPKAEKRPKVQFPVDINFFGAEEEKIITLTSPVDLKEVMELCLEGEGKRDIKDKGRGKKDWCKKLDISEIDDCIKDYINENYPDDKIIHSRTILTKDDITIHIVKLHDNGVLKFGEDCEFID
ncbi:MAG: hypothetical protein CMB81_04330 [Flammeovirgaceae bacterium]|nr:hypothetical protein [Flammeovirgaceae bacterium]